jgi:hypothetical protein
VTEPVGSPTSGHATSTRWARRLSKPDRRRFRCRACPGGVLVEHWLPAVVVAYIYAGENERHVLDHLARELQLEPLEQSWDAVWIHLELVAGTELAERPRVGLRYAAEVDERREELLKTRGPAASGYEFASTWKREPAARCRSCRCRGCLLVRSVIIARKWWRSS